MAKWIILLLTLICCSSSFWSFNMPCEICHEILFEYQKSIPRKPTEVILDYIATKYCIKKKLQNPNVCKGAVTEMMDSIVNSVWRHYTDPHSICHKLRFCPKEYKIRNLTQDITQILQGKPDKQW